MSDKPEVHYWASGMRPEAAQKYLLDLCGSESQNYTENPREVTCERCVAALRAGRGAPGTRPESEAPSTVEVADPPTWYGAAAVAEQVRAAVLSERLAIIAIIEKVAGNKNCPRALVPARILETIARERP